jgi:hypothetical protein
MAKNKKQREPQSGTARAPFAGRRTGLETMLMGGEVGGGGGEEWEKVDRGGARLAGGESEQQKPD